MRSVRSANRWASAGEKSNWPRAVNATKRMTNVKGVFMLHPCHDVMPGRILSDD